MSCESQGPVEALRARWQSDPIDPKIARSVEASMLTLVEALKAASTFVDEHVSPTW
jgi:hypothetical protein